MSSSSIVSGSRSSRPVGNPTMLPVGVLLDILMQCDYETLLNVEKSCEFFQKLVDNRFWLRKCRREKIAVPSAAWDAFPKPLSSDEKESSDAQELPVKKARQEYEEPREPKLYQFDYKKLYCKNPLNRNLAHPMEADTTLEELERDHNVTFHHSGDGIFIEVVPESASNELEDPRVKSCFALSFDWCCRSFVINLVEIGLDADFIDHIRPKITFRELCCCRNDCGARYALAVALLSNEEEILNDFPVARMVELGKEWAQWEGGKKWETVEHVFEDYPAGVRRIYVNSTGKDTQFWAGHYGPKFTNTEVIIEMPSKLQWRSKNDVVDTEVEEERRN